MTASSSPQTNNNNSPVKIVKVNCHEAEESYLKDGVANLFRLYYDELFKVGCDLGFQGFQNEWIDLPGKYDFKKRGGLFVAVVQTNAASSTNNCNEEMAPLVVGCIALRPMEEDDLACAEVKRMFIRDDFRRKGIGNMLANAVINHAWEEGYDEIKLDSLERLEGAVKLYERLGFQRISQYCECPEDDHVCMNLYRKSLD